MSQPPVSGPGQGEQPARDLGLANFTQDGPGDACLPGPGLAAVLDRLCGPDQRCPGADDDQLIGLLGRWQALEAWAAAGKLGVARELLRRRARHPGQDLAPGDLPQSWDRGTGHEIAAALSLSLPAADKLADFSWALRARLPGIGVALAQGIIDNTKAAIIVRELAVLDDDHAAAAEALILSELAGKTAAQIGRLAAAAVCTVDPLGTQKRREYAEREDARVRLWRDNSGTSALAGYALPTDAALAAHAAISQRAKDYKKANVSPDAKMDQLRVLAFCDILNGITLDARITQARAAQAQAEPDADGTDPADADGSGPVGTSPAPGEDEPAGGEPGRTGPGGEPGPRGPGGDPGPAGAGGGAGPALPALANLTFPLATLQQLADRPGDVHGFGPLDPALVRDLAAAAARSPHSKWCLTITDARGYAIGHGCARLARPARAKRAAPRRSRDRDSPWTLRPRDGPGPKDGYGSWTLTLPGGRELIIDLEPVPVTDCDHRHESRSYQPSHRLRHLVEIRDGTCTFPSCSRHARNCDYEHTTPYGQGGRSCACNGSARSRRCHQVKQSRGWTVTQPLPGWHQWRTPSGRTYAQGPMRYAA